MLPITSASQSGSSNNTSLHKISKQKIKDKDIHELNHNLALITISHKIIAFVRAGISITTVAKNFCSLPEGFISVFLI